MTNRNLLWMAAVGLAVVAFFAMLLSNVLFLTTVWHYSTLRAGLAITPGPLLVAVADQAERQGGVFAGTHLDGLGLIDDAPVADHFGPDFVVVARPGLQTARDVLPLTAGAGRGQAVDEHLGVGGYGHIQNHGLAGAIVVGRGTRSRRGTRLVGHGATDREYRNSVFVFLATLPVPILTLALMRYGSPFKRLQRFLRPLIGESLSQDAASLDHELRACLGRRSSVIAAGAWQFAALLSGAFEIWFALRLFGHPVSVATAVALESLNQATRHVAFFVPAGLGVQEAGLIVFGQLLGINGELALALSMVKRMREVLWGVPSLLSWQWFEGRQLEKQLRNAP